MKMNNCNQMELGKKTSRPGDVFTQEALEIKNIYIMMKSSSFWEVQFWCSGICIAPFVNSYQQLHIFPVLQSQLIKCFVQGIVISIVTEH